MGQGGTKKLQQQGVGCCCACCPHYSPCHPGIGAATGQGVRSARCSNVLWLSPSVNLHSLQGLGKASFGTLTVPRHDYSCPWAPPGAGGQLSMLCCIIVGIRWSSLAAEVTEAGSHHQVKGHVHLLAASVLSLAACVCSCICCMQVATVANHRWFRQACTAGLVGNCRPRSPGASGACIEGGSWSLWLGRADLVCDWEEVVLHLGGRRLERGRGATAWAVPWFRLHGL